MAEEYGQKSREMGFSRSDSESGFIHGYDEAKRSDPDVMALVEAVRAATQTYEAAEARIGSALAKGITLGVYHVLNQALEPFKEIK